MWRYAMMLKYLTMLFHVNVPTDNDDMHRRRKAVQPKARYAMALYECDEGYEFPSESADRMFCSRNKWVGPTPVCLPKGTLLHNYNLLRNMLVLPSRHLTINFSSSFTRAELSVPFLSSRPDFPTSEKESYHEPYDPKMSMILW